MSVALWSAIEALVDAALDLPVRERSAFLERRCGGDAQRLAAARQWLDACEHTADSIFPPAIRRGFDVEPSQCAARTGDSACDDPPPRASGARVGVWQLREEIGRGGMGAVYLAERVDLEVPLRAALKFMHRGMAFDEVGVRRFRDERRILAGLEHPAIARLLDAGVDDGLPWFAMEHVRGAPIDAWCDERALSVAARVTLFCRVCEAVQHAHARLVVHRDLKPANILVTDDGEPKLLDFGIAKLLDDPTGDDAALTRPGAGPMTVAYAAPEQIRGDAPSIATDIYSLGVMLHVLLYGTLPRAAASAVADAPGTINTIATARGTTPAKLRRALRGDLEVIVSRAMHRDRERRYPTAEALAADLRRHLGARPVLARADSRLYRARKFLSRHPVGSALGVASALLILAFGVATGVQSQRVRAQSRQLQAQAVRLVAERDKATEVTAFLTGVLASADPYRPSGGTPTLREVLDRGAARAESSLVARPEIRAHLLSAIAPAYFGLGDLDRAGALAADAVAIRRTLHDPRHKELAASLIYLASVRVNQLRAREAETHAREALAIIAHNGNTALTDRTSALSVLGVALQKQGRLDEAERVLRDLLTVEGARRPLDSLRVAQLSRNLGHTLRDRGAYADALPLYRRAYELHRGVYGAEHPETANSAVNFGLAHFHTGSVAAAESLLRAGVATKRRLLGLTHHDVAQDQLALAMVLASRGAHEESRRLRAEVERQSRSPRSVGAKR